MDIRSFFAPKGGVKPKPKSESSLETNNNRAKDVKKKTPPKPEKKQSNRSKSSERKEEKSTKGRNKSGDSKSKANKETKKPVLTNISDDEVVLIEDVEEKDNIKQKKKNEEKIEKEQNKCTESKKEKKKNGSVNHDSEEESPIGRKKKKQLVSDDESDEVKKVNKKGKGKKKHRLFESDSEEEDPLPKKSRKKKKEAVIYLDDSDEEVKKPKPTMLDTFVMNTPTPKKKEEKKKTEQKTAVNAADFFGSGLVTRVERSTTGTKRKSSQVDENKDEDIEMHDDDDFIKTLEQLDQQQTKRPKLEDTISEIEKSPEKPSLAKKLADKVKTSSVTVSETPEKEMKSGDNNNNNSKHSKKPSPSKLKNLSPKKSPVKVEKIETPVKTKATPKKISPNTDSKKTSPDADTPLMQRKASYRSYLHRDGPQALGSKEIPEGAENCLEGLTFVLTGVYESIERDEAKSLIEKYGGKVTTSLSKKTNYIVVGRDAGESKLSKATQFGTKQLDEDGLFELIKSRPGKKSKYEIQAEETVKKEKWLEKKLSMQKEEKPVAGSSKTSDTIPKSSHSGGSESKKPIGQSKANDQSEPVLLWVDKHKPASMKTIIGQQGDKSNAKKLFNWLNSWHKNRAAGTKPAGKFFNNKSDDGSGFKAALLSGPPGVGKTTTATLVCKEAGFSYVELNASDTRSKKSLQTEVAESLDNQTLVDFMGTKPSHKDGQKHCLIMDEVDGMAGNADRGGLQELVQLIKGSKIPVLCICNDRNSTKMRTLSNYCFDLRFYKPRLEQIKGAMMSLAFKEGIKISPPAMNEIILAANQDIRQVIHNLSMWSATDKGLTYEQAKQDSKSAKKDMKIGPFDVCRKVFIGGEETAGMTIHDKSNLFFNDYSIAPLFVQENYASVIPFSARGNTKKHLRLLSQTADSIADGDLCDRLIRREGNWSMLPMQAMYASVIPGEFMRGSFPQMVAFPSWLGKNSSTNKTDRLLAELSMHMRLNISGDKRSMSMDYLPVLRKCLTEPLVREAGEGVPKVIKLMDDYDITKDDFDNVMEVSKWPNSTDPLGSLDSKTKAAFTRTYNKECHLTPYATGAAPKKKRGRGAGDEDGEELLKMEGEEDGGTAISDDEEDNGLETDTMIKAKKPAAKGRVKKEPAEKATTKGGKGKGRGKGKS
ncbi:hypothetical protein SNE40_021461 [Patella caerulea]|uniref:Replication factor C subunit 1 n=1 Tax=Patella caerulea TaxID=87958 RepID=A0AAN8GIS2_PATCE